MKANPSAERGSAMILVSIVVTSLMLMIVCLLTTTTVRSQSEALQSGDFVRFRTADAAISRAQLMINRHTSTAINENWLQYWAGTRLFSGSPIHTNVPAKMYPVGTNVSASNTSSWRNGKTYFDLPLLDGSASATLTEASTTPPDETARVRVFVLEPPQSGDSPFTRVYLLVARIETGGLNSGDRMVRSLACQVRPLDTFARYARFTTKDLGISVSNATYTGEVHSNGTVTVSGSNDTFTELVTSSNGSVINSGSGNSFLVGTQTGTPPSDPPTMSDIKNEEKKLPGGSEYTAESEYAGCAVTYDTRNTEFITNFYNATGYTANSNDTLAVSMSLKNDKVEVTTVLTKASNGSTLTWTQTAAQTDPDPLKRAVSIPNAGFFYVGGTLNVSGNMSRRASIMVTGNVTIDKPIRYVDDSGDPQYKLYNSNGTTEASFSTSTNSWNPSDDDKWNTTNNPVYKANPTWEVPDTGYPTLGIVSASYIYAKPQVEHAEIHATLFSTYANPNTAQVSQGVKFSGISSSKNLYLLGGLDTTDACPVSNFTYFQIVYDTLLQKYAPPPHFPKVIRPTYSCWHEVQTELNSDNTTYRLVDHDYYGRTIGGHGNTWGP